MSYLPAIGFEVHVQLRTRSKMFCACPNEQGAPPNTNVCPVCLGMPGALPVPNRAAFELGILIALALGADISSATGFARKSYFYPDLPKGYQITQHGSPLALGGSYRAGTADRAVRVRQIHLEEDAGKTTHAKAGGSELSLVDMNRCGIPLAEIVTEPDIESPEEASGFLKELRRVLVFLGVTRGRMQKGELRFDTNVSLRAGPDAPLGRPTEIKNLNSFRSVRAALGYEIERQSRALESGTPVERETLLWDPSSGRAIPMRTKEASRDYRYFREPDLPDYRIGDEWVDSIREAMPELPRQAESRLVRSLGLREHDARLVSSTPETLEFFERVLGEVAAGGPRTVASVVANWVNVILPDVLRDAGIERAAAPEAATRLAEVLTLRLRGDIGDAAARTLLLETLRRGLPVARLVSEMELYVIDDAEALRAIARGILASYPGQARRWASGEERLRDFFMGLIMKETRGRADPATAVEALEKELSRV